jgi:hypothetical protein
MKKELFLAIISLVVVAAFITSCATAPPVKYYVCSDGRQVLDAKQCALPAPPKVEPTPPPVFNESEPAPIKVILTDSVKTLFEKSAKVNDMLFYYIETPNIAPDNKYFMSRDKMKIELMKKVILDPSNQFDTIYLDLVGKTGWAYCEERSPAGLCPDRNKIYDVDYNTYMIITPFEWIKRITWADVTGKSKSLYQRTAVEVTFKIKDTEGSMWVDGYWGIPMYVTYNGNTFDYRDIAVNMLNESELVHQHLES